MTAQMPMSLQPAHWHPVLPPSVLAQPGLQLDLSGTNPALASVAVDDAEAFGQWIGQRIAAADCQWAIGGYGEHRGLYSMSPLFGDEGPARSVHLGVDCWLPAGTEVYATRDGRVHSTANNARFGDYGPTIILAHETASGPLHSLYGHLAPESLTLTRPGQTVSAGQHIGWLGEPRVNVGWPPHLHFQLIRDMGQYHGDFPGVCAAQDREQWLSRCPDPMPLFHAWCAKLCAPDLRKP